MKQLIWAVAAMLVGSGAGAVHPESAGDWIQANEHVREAGGWKAYAREINAAQDPEKSEGNSKFPILLLDAALERAKQLDPLIVRAYGTASGDVKAYPLLSDVQRSALSWEARLQAEVRSLYFSAVAANELLQYQLRVHEAASVASELANRMHKVGNLSRLLQAEEALTLAEAERALSKARIQANASREALIQRLQLTGQATMFSIPARLPELPAAKESVAISEIDSKLLSSINGTPLQIKAQSELRQALLARDEAYGIAKHYRDTVLPLQKQISEEHLLRYNGMIIGVFELLRDAKKQVQAVQGYLDALRVYWVAEAALAPKLLALREELLMTRRDAWK